MPPAQKQIFTRRRDPTTTEINLPQAATFSGAVLTYQPNTVNKFSSPHLEKQQTFQREELTTQRLLEMPKKGGLNPFSHHHHGNDTHENDSDHHHHHSHHGFLSMLSPIHHHPPKDKDGVIHQDDGHHHHHRWSLHGMLSPLHRHRKADNSHSDHDHDDHHHHHHHRIKSILSRFHRHRHHHHDHSSSSHAPASPTHESVTASMLEQKVNAAESIITRWDAETNSYAKITPLFRDDRAEAHEFLSAVAELQNTMIYFVNNELGGASVSRSHALVRGQNLMQIAMRRLERDFYQILSANRDQLDPESISTNSSGSSISIASDGGDDADEDIRAAGEFISDVERASALAMADLRDIADIMISAGYSKECTRIYKVLRKSIVDEGLYRLGFERLAPNQIQKLDGEVLDHKIRTWISAAKVVVKTLFSGERILCDHVFGGSVSISESCFADVARDAAVQFFGFAESVTKTKRLPEKMFRILDLYDAISDYWPETQSIFSSGSTAVVRSQAQTSLQKLSEVARSTLADFEASIQKDPSKAPKDATKSLPPGAGIHPLTRYATTYIISLADYDAALTEILAEGPIQPQSPLPDFFFETPPPSSPSTASFSSSSSDEPVRLAVASRLARLLLVLLCKLDSKAGMYRDGAISYLFLANNLWFIVRKASESKLGYLLGEDWATRHGVKARQYAKNYERLAWGKVAAATAAAAAMEGVEEALDRMNGFNAAFEETIKSQRGFEIPDEELREEVKAAITEMFLSGYRILYERCRDQLQDSATGVVRFAPEDVSSRLSGLFEHVDGSVSPHGSSKTSSRSG